MLSATQMPAHVAEVRREVCAVSCENKCTAYLAGTLQHDDPHVACPRIGWILAWGCYGPCDGPTPPHTPRKAAGSPPQDPPDEPTVAELAENFAGAMERWVTAGAPVVSKEQYAARAAACEACPLWDGSARFGLGKCNAPGCGCTKFKRWLATEQCKHPAGSRWPDLTTERPSGGSN